MMLVVSGEQRIVYKLLVAGPAILTLCLGVHGWTQDDRYVPISYSDLQTQRLLNYREAVRSSKIVEKSGFRRMDPVAVRASVNQWLQDSRSGRIRPVAGVAHEDDSSIPVRREIISANFAVSTAASLLALKEADAGRYWTATQDALDAVEVLRIVKFTDLALVPRGSVIERRAYRVLEATASQLTDDEKAQVRARLDSMGDGTFEFGRLVSHSRRLYTEYRSRMGKGATLPIEENPRLTQIVFSGEKATPAEQILLADRSEALMVMSGAELGRESHDLTIRDRRNALEALR